MTLSSEFEFKTRLQHNTVEVGHFTPSFRVANNRRHI